MVFAEATGAVKRANILRSGRTRKNNLEADKRGFITLETDLRGYIAAKKGLCIALIIQYMVSSGGGSYSQALRAICRIANNL